MISLLTVVMVGVWARLAFMELDHILFWDHTREVSQMYPDRYNSPVWYKGWSEWKRW